MAQKACKNDVRALEVEADAYLFLLLKTYLWCCINTSSVPLSTIGCDSGTCTDMVRFSSILMPQAYLCLRICTESTLTSSMDEQCIDMALIFP